MRILTSKIGSQSKGTSVSIAIVLPKEAYISSYVNFCERKFIVNIKTVFVLKLYDYPLRYKKKLGQKFKSR